MNKFIATVGDTANPLFLAREIIELDFPVINNEDEFYELEDEKELEWDTYEEYLEELADNAYSYLFNNGYQSAYYSVKTCYPYDKAIEVMKEQIEKTQEFLENLT